MNTKNFIYSRTIWIAVVQGILGILTVMNSVSPEMEGAGSVMTIMALLQFINRFLTEQKVTLN